MMKKIYVIDEHISSTQNGIGTFLQEFIRCLKKLNTSIHPVVFNSKYPEFSIEYRNGMEYYYFPKFPAGDFISHPGIVCYFLSLHIPDSPDNIFCINHSPCAELLERLKQSHPLSKIVFFIHDLSWTGYFLGNSAEFTKKVVNCSSPKVSSKYVQLKNVFEEEQRMNAISDKVVCLSKDTYRLLIESYRTNKEKIFLIPNGLSNRKTRQILFEKEEAKREMYLDEKERIILFVGRPSKAKGLQALLESFRQVLESHPHTRLVIAGPHSPHTQNLISEKFVARITCTGLLSPSELRKWYQIADVGVIPSYTEQCSYVGIEMMMHGLPIVTSDGFGVRNMFYDGVNALVAPIGSRHNSREFSLNLTKALNRILSSHELAIKLGRQAREYYLSHYKISFMSAGYKRLLESL